MNILSLYFDFINDHKNIYSNNFSRYYLSGSNSSNLYLKYENCIFIIK